MNADHRVYERLVQMTDAHVEYALQHQVTEPGRHRGGIVNPHTGLPSPSHGGTAAYIASMACALTVPQSRYYQAENVREALESAVDYMLHRQHSDGTISLGGTNFHSPPDTSFVAAGFTQVYRLLQRAKEEPVQRIADKLLTFLSRTIPALVTGGCHTPNHRWVMTAALGSLYSIFGNSELAERAEEWLAEGMDCTEDGEWTERSNGIYNTVNDIMLYYTSVYLNRPGLLEHVRRNLSMMVCMLHHDNEIVTDYSDRQDFGQPHDLSEYFLSYRLMAAHDRNPLFAAMYDKAAAAISRPGPVNNHALLGFLIFPCELDSIERSPLPEQYAKLFNAGYPLEANLARMEQAGHHSRILHSRVHTAFGAPVARYRDHETSVTIMARTPSFFSLRHGKVKLHGIRLSTLFSPGVVHMDTLQADPDFTSFQLKARMKKGYNGPIPKEHLPASANEPVSPWYLLPHQLRPLTHVQTHSVTVEIRRGDGCWTICLSTDDLEDVITQVTFLFDRSCRLSGEGLETSENGILAWKTGTLRCEAGNDWLEMEAGEYRHKLHAPVPAAHEPGLQPVTVNLLSPYVKTFTIRLSPAR